VTEAAGVGQKDPHLTIFKPVCRAAVLVCDPCRLFSALTKARFIEHQNGLRITQALQDVGSQIVTHQVGIPDGTIQQPLHAVRSGFSGVFRQLPAIFALDGTDNAFQIGQRSTTRFRSDKTRGDTSVETFEFLAPPPNFDKGGLRASCGDVLGLFHAFFLSHEPCLGLSFS
jgi:hypothetical protein